MFYRVLIPLCLIVFTAVTASADPVSATGIVVADNLNIRVKPQNAATVVGKFKRGTHVSVIAKVENSPWYQVLVPEDADVFLAAQFVKDGKTSRDVNLRGGSGINFESYGIVPAGTPVRVIGETPRKDWVKVAPPEGLTAFVSSTYVKISEAEAKVIPEKKLSDMSLLATREAKAVPLAEQARDVRISDRNADQNDLAASQQIEARQAELNLPPPRLTPEEREQKFKVLERRFLADSAKDVTVSGRISPLVDQNLAVSHGLVEERPDKNGELSLKAIGYLYCQKISLADFENKRVRIEGTRFFVDGWNAPVIVVKRVIPEE